MVGTGQTLENEEVEDSLSVAAVGTVAVFLSLRRQWQFALKNTL